MSDSALSHGAEAAVAGAWSARRTLAFIMITCGTFWAAVLALILR